MMKACFFIAALVLISCTRPRMIYYSYNGDTISRVDEQGRASFYFGFCDNEAIACPTSCILAEYDDLDGIMTAFMIFGSSGKVDFFPLYDHFAKIGSDSSLRLQPGKENIDYIPWEDSLQLHFSNAVRVQNSLDAEKLYNSKRGSKVDVKYN